MGWYGRLKFLGMLRNWGLVGLISIMYDVLEIW